MKIIAIILILATSSSALNMDKHVSSQGSKIRSLETGHKSKKHQLQIERETGLDGKVRSIRFDLNDDAGVRVYGMPKNKMIDASKVEKSDPKPVLRGDPRGSRVAEMTAETRMKDNGHIERVSMENTEGSHVEVVKVNKRSVESAKKNDDLEGAEAKVFRPLFVYRQQVNRRKVLRDKKRRIYKKPISPKPRPVYYYPNRIY